MSRILSNTDRMTFRGAARLLLARACVFACLCACPSVCPSAWAQTQDPVPPQLPSAADASAAPAAVPPAIPPAPPNAVVPNAAAAPASAAAPAMDASALSPAESVTLENVEKSLAAHLAIDPAATQPANMKTLFFTAWQYALLVEARQTFKTRPAGGGNAATGGTEEAHRDPGPREISLGGISYANAKNWTIWLNSQRIKPDAIPSQVMALKVTPDHVDLKWFDVGSNLIYPIRLRAHQRFDLDNRIFLPGAGTAPPATTPKT